MFTVNGGYDLPLETRQSLQGLPARAGRAGPPRTQARAPLGPAHPTPAAPPRWRFWPVLLSAVAAFLIANVAVIVAGRAFAIPLGHLDQLTPEQVAILTLSQDVTLAVVLVALLRLWPKVRPAALGLAAPPA